MNTGARLPSAPPVAAGPRERRRLVVRGVVQGVGFRPFVHRLAVRHQLTGLVGNDSGSVFIEVEGPPDALDAFTRGLRADAPPLAAVESVTARLLPGRGDAQFTIVASEVGPGRRTLVPPDVAACPDCLRETADPADRRYRYPFTTCTACGPRYTIITGLPYDRPATTMAGFALCPACRREYTDPTDRRFHAEPTGCPACGPRLRYHDRAAVAVVVGDGALRAAQRALASGGILAIKGLGGYHLGCDATDADAVGRLRARKGRPAKPFAVLTRDLAAAGAVAEIGPVDAALLAGRERPIVLVGKRADAAPLADNVAPGTAALGLFLPYTPLHELLFAEPRALAYLVLTSGNVAGEPIVHDDGEALRRLAPLVDGWLAHDRPIATPCDDSVVRHVGGRQLPIRRSRGYAPVPVPLPFDVPDLLAVGGELKCTVAVGCGRSAFLSQHLGDVDTLATLRAVEATVDHLVGLFRVTPEAVAADLHPGYRTGRWARRYAGSRPLLRIQHHHAHVAACMAEHGVPPGEPVIGIAFDGTGYGTDGAVWGGEALLATYAGFERLAHLGYVPLPGGDAAVRRPYRSALAHLRRAGVAWTEDLPPVAACDPVERGVLARQLDRGLNTAPTSSMGRLFDAVAALAGVRQVVDYEAQAAIELESITAATGDDEGYRFGWPTDPVGGPVDPGPVIRAVVADVRAGVPAGRIGARLHAGVADLIRDLAIAARQRTGVGTVALSGGVFQNAPLVMAAERRLGAAGFRVLTHRLVPPNDGGLALGQLVVAAASMRTAADRRT